MKLDPSFSPPCLSQVAQKVGCPTDSTANLANCLKVTDPKKLTLAYHLEVLNLQCELFGGNGPVSQCYSSSCAQGGLLLHQERKVVLFCVRCDAMLSTTSSYSAFREDGCPVKSWR